MAAEEEGCVDISGVLSVISLVLLLPPNSPHPPTLPLVVAPFTRSELAHVHPLLPSGGGGRELGGLPGALLSSPRPSSPPRLPRLFLTPVDAAQSADG